MPRAGGGGNNDDNNNNNANTATAPPFTLNTNVLSVAAETAAASSVESTTSSSLLQIVATTPPSRPTISIQAQAGILAPVVLEDLPAANLNLEPDVTSSIPALALSTSASAEIPSLAEPSQPQAVASDAPPQEGPASMVVATSVADDSDAATLATLASFSETQAPATPAPEQLPPSEGGAQIFTTIGTANPTDDAAAAANTDSTTLNGAVQPVDAPNSRTESTIAVAGGVVGGVALISLVVFFVWWWKRRSKRRRRSTLLTPLGADPVGGGRGEKRGAYTIARGSIGPTPRGERIKASFDANMKKMRSRLGSIVGVGGGQGSMSSVNMNRGNSQFMEDSLTRRPTNASGSSGRRQQLTPKDRVGDWWSRVTANAGFSWRTRQGTAGKEPADPFAAAREKTAMDMTARQQPDFLTLLNMDERELEREAQKQGLGGRRGPPSVMSTNTGASVPSTVAPPRFLSDLNLGFGPGAGAEDPFSDAHSLARDSAKPVPLVVSRADNPFSDANAIDAAGAQRGKGNGGPNTYIADMRRSRGQSFDQGPTGGGRQSTAGGRAAIESMYRESIQSVDTYAARRNNKFRSDPFDLERPELLGNNALRAAKTTSSNMSTAGSSAPRLSDIPSSDGGSFSAGGEVRRPPPARPGRSSSFASKYSSGISLGDWSDPGPDVGPAAVRWGEGRSSAGSQRSEDAVGKAL